MKANIQSVSDSYLCCNCGACSAACPQEAIQFRYSSLGRKFAEVNSRCVNCGLCLKVCPSVDSNKELLQLMDFQRIKKDSIKIGKSTNELYYSNSQSGGAVAAILDYLFQNQMIDAALVCRMEKGDLPDCKGIIITSAQEITTVQKSCYTPVCLLESLQTANAFISLAIVGLPCHLHGASLLSKNLQKFRNIKYKIGLICDRSLCSGIMPVMKKLSGLDNSIHIQWRKKNFCKDGTYYPYQEAPVVISNENEDVVLDRKYRFALKEFFTSPRCRVCPDKMNAFADIVCGDPWGMTGVDLKEGESLIFARTELGNDIVEDMSSSNYLRTREGSLQEVYTGQHIQRKETQVKVYSKAFSVFPRLVESYLLSLGDEQQINPTDLSNAERVFLEFQERERKNPDQILRSSISRIKKYERNEKFNSFLWVRLAHKIINIFKK